MSVNAGRARLAVTVAWAAFFVLLWLTGESQRYLGARTQWLVPFGALTLSVAALLTWRSARTSSSLRIREAIGLFTLILPLALFLLAPHAELGAYAASRKSSAFFPAVKPPPPARPQDVGLLDIYIAERDEEFARTSNIHPGTRVAVLGIVTHADRGHFSLTRFYITCCIADAIPLTIDVTSRRPVTPNDWVWVRGTLKKRPSAHYSIAGERVTTRRSPRNPYLSFSSS